MMFVGDDYKLCAKLYVVFIVVFTPREKTMKDEWKDDLDLGEDWDGEFTTSFL